jgi:hypothetical protein
MSLQSGPRFLDCRVPGLVRISSEYKEYLAAIEGEVFKRKVDVTESEGATGGQSFPYKFRNAFAKIRYRATFPKFRELFLQSGLKLKLYSYFVGWATLVPPSSQRAIETAVDVCSREACNVSVIYFPNSPSYRHDATSSQYGDALEAFVSKYQKTGLWERSDVLLNFVNISAQINDLGEKAFAPGCVNRKDDFILQCHYSKEGYAVAASALFRSLTKLKG